MFEQSTDVIGYLQQRNAINVLEALHHIENPCWRSVKDYTIHELKAPSLSDCCYRKLCKQLVTLGLAGFVERDPIKKDYYLTEQGHEMAEIVDNAIERIGKWRKRAEKRAGEGSAT